MLAYRERTRARPAPLRAMLTALGWTLFVASFPLVVLLPELGIPVLLVALRLLAVEAHWAARAYAWTDWRFAQLRAWFHRQSRLFRAAILIALLGVAVALVWLLIYEL